jgi:transposase
MLEIEINYIRDNYRMMTREELSDHLGVSTSTIRYYIEKLNLEGKKKEWTIEEIVFMKLNYPEIGCKKLAKIFDRSHHTVNRKLKEIGLKK